MRRHHVGLALLLLASACAPHSQLRRAAKTARWGELGTLIHDANRTGGLKLNGIRRTARSLLEGELERARGSKGASRVLSLASCARALEKELESRAQTKDPPGGAALLLTVELKARKRELAKSRVDLTERHFRAAYARSLVETPEVRRPFLRDVEPLVRRAALDSALERHTSEDLAEMLEISRRDPDDLCRSKALRWLGADPSPRALSALLDRFEAGDEKQRLFVLAGLFGQARSVRAAGETLYHIVLGLPDAVASPGDTSMSLTLSEQKLRVRERLLSYAENGALDERMSVLSRHTDSSDGWFRLLQKSTDPMFARLAIVSWQELLGFEETRKAAEKQLQAYATNENGEGALARRALAERGFSAIVPLLKRDLNHSDVAVRQDAAMNLLTLGRIETVAPLLADEDADLRVDVACQMLAY
jgi:HEAT repeat protein